MFHGEAEGLVGKFSRWPWQRGFFLSRLIPGRVQKVVRTLLFRIAENETGGCMVSLAFMRDRIATAKVTCYGVKPARCQEQG
jgi:hypothetical protein